MRQRELKLENWQEEYKRKLVSPEEAARTINSGDNIFIPNVYLGNLVFSIIARRGELRDVKVEICNPLFDPGWLLPGMEESFEIIIRIFLQAARIGHDEGRIPYLPYTNGTWIKPYRDNRPMNRDVDVFLVEVTPPDENGFCNFGYQIWESSYYAKRAKTVIAEIDESLIRARGDTSIHISEIDYLVEIPNPPFNSDEIEKIASRLPPEKQAQARKVLPLTQPKIFRNMLPLLDQVPVEAIESSLNIDEPDDVMKAIAANLKGLLRDRDTIQIGTGKHTKHLVNLGVFDDLNDLSIFSEMACPGMGFLVKRGIVTGKYASLHPGKAIFTALLGMTNEEILWAHDNPLFELYPGEYVIDIANISKNENMVSMNKAVGVDLTGQLTCESQFGSRLINGAGGQIEFHIGAFMSKGGRAVTILPSTWGDGAVSNIVPQFEKGTLITISRYWADYVVTEYGVAQLAGKTHRERTEELIQVAHPKFRDELREAAREIC